MLIGIIGDTHDQIPELKKTLKALRSKGVEILIHAGDWVSAFTLEYYRDISIPIRGVWGNNAGDQRFSTISKKIGLDLEIEEMHKGIYGGRRILVTHEAAPTPPDVDVHIYGHDHVSNIERLGGTLRVNPGTLLRETFPWLNSKPSFAVYDTENDEAKVLYLDYL